MDRKFRRRRPTPSSAIALPPVTAAGSIRAAAISLAAMSLAACSSPLVLQNPQTGETVTCTEGVGDWSPWSQQQACIGDHIAQGWVVENEE
jgi:hypothetical protein